MPPQDDFADPRIAQLLQFRPWPIWDPVPWWILRALDDRVIKELAVVQLETQRAVLKAQMDSIERTVKILGSAGPRG